MKRLYPLLRGVQKAKQSMRTPIKPKILWNYSHDTVKYGNDSTLNQASCRARAVRTFLSMCTQFLLTFWTRLMDPEHSILRPKYFSRSAARIL